MDKKNIIKIISITLFFGALWGLIEATLGYLVHLLPDVFSGLSGTLLFPIGFYFMYRAYEKTKRMETVMYVGLVTAIIKLTDFILPAIHPALILPLVKIISPAIAIIFEAVSVFIILYMINGNALKFNIGHAVITSFSWRILFFIYQYILFITELSASFINSGAMNLLRFIFMETAINAIIIMGLMFFFKNREQKALQENHSFIFSNSFISLAISVVLLFSTITINILLKLG